MMQTLKRAMVGLTVISAALGLSLSALSAQDDIINIKEINRSEDIPQTLPNSGHYRVHMIDVGTGLAILVQGHDWNLLFDAGSGDDKAGNQSSGDSKSRVLAYLYHAIGASGGRKCVPADDGLPTHNLTQRTINYMILSHPHEDHGAMMDDVLDCYKVETMWDSGGINDRAFYARILERVKAEAGIRYLTANGPSNPKRIKLPKQNKNFDFSNVDWGRFNEEDTIQLDADARLTVLHAEGGTHDDANHNSIVMRLDLGAKSILLTGDAESGPRKLPSAPVADIEKHLIDEYFDLIDVDILQVGHHGSMTSSRSEFIDAVSPSLALVSVGPKKYGSVILPDVEVIDSLSRKGIKILRTDIYDDNGCPVGDPVGRNDSDNPGGCANFVLEW